MTPLKTGKIAFLVAAILVLILGSLHAAHADATITVVNLDNPGEGFNDASAPEPDSTAGGNTGATLGEQRLIAFQHAADIWGEIVDSNVEIKVGAKFDPSTCGPASAVVGSAGPTTVHRDFPGAPESNTWYAQALANSFAGTDLSPNNDISATFNSAIGTTCSFPNVWYYGLDGNPPGNNLDFVGVVLHELAHGLGFLTFVSLTNGARLLGYDDAFMLHLEDHSTGKLYPDMTNGERITASKDTGDSHWIGPSVVADGAILRAGRHTSGHVEMYAPASQQPGSSVSHFSTSLFPDQLMEPSYTGPTRDVGLARALMEDIGWGLHPDLIVSTVTVSDDTLTTSQSFTINATVENSGDGSSDSTTLRYYRSTDSTISTADTQFGTDPVPALSPNGESAESISATAPGSPGTYWIGACVNSVSGESSTNNNCSAGVQITVSSPPTYPDLIVSTVNVSDDTLTTSQSFTINATVENRGDGSSDSTTLRYYRSTDSAISKADTQFGTDPVSALSPGGVSAVSFSATAPGSPGTYWIGACVNSVSGESSTNNNCSAGVQIAVSSSPNLRQSREYFEFWPPEGWSIINNSGNCSWESNSTTGTPNYTESTGYCADANSDWCGLDSAMDTELRTPVLNFTKITSARLSYVSSYNNFSESGFAHVDMSTNGGNTWVNLLKWQEDHYANGPGETVSIDLKQYVGFSDLVIRFHYYAPDGFGWWQIDNVVIRSGNHNAMPWIPFLLLDDDND